MADQSENSYSYALSSATSVYSAVLSMAKKRNLVVQWTHTDFADTANAGDTITITVQHSLDPNAADHLADDKYWATLFTKTFTDPELNSAGLTSSNPVVYLYDMYDAADLTNRAKGAKGVGDVIRVKVTQANASGTGTFNGVIYFGYDVAVTSS